MRQRCGAFSGCRPPPALSAGAQSAHGARAHCPGGTPILGPSNPVHRVHFHPVGPPKGAILGGLSPPATRRRRSRGNRVGDLTAGGVFSSCCESEAPRFLETDTAHARSDGVEQRPRLESDVFCSVTNSYFYHAKFPGGTEKDRDGVTPSRTTVSTTASPARAPITKNLLKRFGNPLGTRRFSVSSVG